MELLDGSLGEAVGQLYVAKYWPAETARQANELVADVHAAYAKKIAGAAWMDETTRKAALEKLAAFDPRVGHPVKWIDYSTLKVSRTDPLANEIATEDFQWKLQLSRFPNPVDRTLWDMTPQTVNAYYDPTMNQITVPAAILQPPFFDANADPAVNYAETGATTIGHEMGHGFDDQGRHMTPRAGCATGGPGDGGQVQGQGGRARRRSSTGIEPIPGVHIKGKLTLARTLPTSAGWRPPMPPIAATSRARRAAGHRRLYRRPALLHRLCAGLAGQATRRRERQQLLSDPHSPESTGSTASSAISTPGTKRSTCSRATSSICRPSSACTSGRPAP